MGSKCISYPIKVRSIGLNYECVCKLQGDYVVQKISLFIYMYV